MATIPGGGAPVGEGIFVKPKIASENYLKNNYLAKRKLMIPQK